jgi:polysaccharide deacetylase family protein (PEP-CTERM system associated)
MILEKVAVLGVDVEDWYHAEYIQSLKINKNYSMLDGLDNIIEIFNELKVKATFFCVAELAHILKKTLQKLHKDGNEIASHGQKHIRPLILNQKQFLNEIIKSKEILEKIISKKVIGFRAPCFSLNRDYFNLLRENNYTYDSSKINFNKHPLYGNLELNDFNQINKYVYEKDNFMEFEIPTTSIFKFNIPFSGGGYIRLLNLRLLKKIIIEMEIKKNPIFFYFHPFELSKKKIIRKNIPLHILLRMSIGRTEMSKKLYNLIYFMKSRGWEFKTFRELQQDA